MADTASHVGAYAFMQLAGGLISWWSSWDAASKQEKKAEEYMKKFETQLQETNTILQQQYQHGKDMYSRWEQDFGTIQTEVADYYKNLTDAVLKQQYEDANTTANQELYQQYGQASKNLNATMNQNGMAGSGQSIAAKLQLQQSMLQQQAQNRWQTEQLKTSAQQQIMSQKASWAQAGQSTMQAASNQIFSALQNQANTSNQLAQLYAQTGMNYQNQAIATEAQGWSMLGSAISSIGNTGLKSAMDKQNSTNPQIVFNLGNTSSSTGGIATTTTDNSTSTGATYTASNPYIGVMSSTNNLNSQLNNYDWVSEIINSNSKNTFYNRNTTTTQKYFGDNK